MTVPPFNRACALLMLGVWCSTASAAAGPEGRLVAKLPGPAGTDVAFSRDGKLLLTAGADQARVWDAETYKPVTEPLKHKDGEKLYLSAISPDGKLVLTVAGNEAWVWDVPKGDRVAVLRHEGKVRSASFSPDGSKVLTAGDDKTTAVWEANTGKRLMTRDHAAPVVFAAFSPDGATAVCQVLGPEEERRDFGGAVEAWDTVTGRGRWRADSDLWPTPEESEWFRRWKSPVAFSPDGRRVAIIHIRNVHLLDAGTGAVSAWADVLDTAGAALAVRFVGDGSALLVATRLGAVVLDVPALLEPAGGRTVPLVQAGPTLYQMQWVAEAEASAKGGRAALGMYGDQVAVAVIDPRSTRPVLELSPEREGGELPAVAMSPDGERLAAGFASEGFTSIYEVNDQGQAQ